MEPAKPKQSVLSTLSGGWRRDDPDQDETPKTFADLDLEREAVWQYGKAKALAESVEFEDCLPNQKAQTIATCNTILGNLAKQQSAIYSSERLKKMEMALLEALRTLPDAQREPFLQVYSDAFNSTLAG